MQTLKYHLTGVKRNKAVRENELEIHHPKVYHLLWVLWQMKLVYQCEGNTAQCQLEVDNSDSE